MKIWVLHNQVSPQAAPDEEDVLVQVEAVTAALRARGHAVAAVAADLDLAGLADRLRTQRPDAVFNLVEGLAGSGRLIHVVPSLLDAAGCRMVGCPTEAVFLTSHKVLAKRLLRHGGLPTPDWLLPAGLAGDGTTPAAESTAGPPARWIVKSIWEDASLGMDDSAVVDGSDAARAALQERQGRPGDPWFAEAYIEGREFNLGLLEGPGGVQVLPPAEMLFADFPAGKPRIVGYAAKWEPHSFEYGHTMRTFDLPPGDDRLLARLVGLARACWDLFDLRGWARVDLRVDEAGQPWILEVNANPCLSPDAGYAAALARTGIVFADAIDGMVDAALARPAHHDGR